MAIKNIICDLGGVILNIDFRKMYQAFEALGVEDVNLIYTQSMQNQLIDHFEIGKISAEEFRNGLRDFLELPISNEEFDQAWNAMLLDLPPERLQFINKLKRQYQLKTFLLSNTNELHLNAIFAQHGEEIFKNYFDKEYYSHEVGMHKPNADIFLKILYDNQLEPKETLFLDDTQKHIDAASSLGLHTQLITPRLTILDIEKLLKR